MSLLLLGAGLSAPSSAAAIIAAAVSAAYTSLGFNQDHADIFAAYYIGKNATLAGVVEDEANFRDHSRSELTSRATSFTTNQRFSGGNTGTGKTALSVFAWVRPTTLSGSAARVIIAEYDYTIADRGWSLSTFGARLNVSISGDGGIVNFKNYLSVDTLSINEWAHVGFVFSAGVLTLFINGKALSEITKETDGSVTTIMIHRK